MKEKPPVRYSKKVVAIVIALNAVFVAAAMVVIWHGGTIPDKLIDRWFDFTTIEVLGTAGLTVVERVTDTITKNKQEEKEND